MGFVRSTGVLCAVIYFWTLVYVCPAQPTFTIKNLSKIPSYERYELVGKGTTVNKIPVVIEYRAKKRGTPDARWEISGSMELPNTRIEEEYVILHTDLQIERYRRRQSFERGAVATKAELDVDVSSDDPDEFIIGTIPGLMYVLRTYPFHSDKKHFRVRTAQQTRDVLNFKVANKGKKKLDTKYFGTIEAFHLEVSLMVPVVGAIIPKLNYYFLDDPQKTLIAVEGIMPATGKRLDVELKSYAVE
ncbi:MAG: hypothetical protein GF350_04595 [Chitinivibrionales bacterium]|nr:hypothetical protein [Chitinivibrionales bacterium]